MQSSRRSGWSDDGRRSVRRQVLRKLRPSPISGLACRGLARTGVAKVATVPMTAILGVENLVVRRGGRVILDGVSVEVGAGEVVAVVGANGTGKSTLLACVAGVLPPRAGRVTIKD